MVRPHHALSSLLVFANGCEDLQQAIEDRVQEEVERATQPTIDVGGGAAPKTEEERLAKKLDPYLVCLDRSMQRIRDSWARYSEDVDPKTGVARRKNTKPFLYKIENELDPCQEAVDHGNDLQPSLPDIESAAQHYLEHGRTFARHAATLHDYYEAEGYADDDWAKGKQIAPEIAAAYESWNAAAQKLDELVSTKKDEVDKLMLALVEKREGKTLHWHANEVVIAAKDFLRCVESHAAGASGCSADYEALSAAIEGFRERAETHPDEADAVFWMTSYRTSVDDYYTRATEMMKVVRENKTKQRGPTFEQLSSQLDDLTSDYDNLRFDFP